MIETKKKEREKEIMEKMKTYLIDNGDLMDEYFMFRSNVPLHELKKMIYENLKDVNLLCEILKGRKYQVTFLGNQDSVSRSSVEYDEVLDLYDFRMFAEREGMLYDLEYAYYDNGYVLDITTCIEGFSYRLYDVCFKLIKEDVYDDESLSIFEVIQDLMAEFSMNLDCAIQLDYTNFRKLCDAAEKVDNELKRYAKNKLENTAFSFLGGSIILPLHMEEFEVCDKFVFVCLYDGKADDKAVFDLLRESDGMSYEFPVAYVTANASKFDSLLKIKDRIIQIRESVKPKVSFTVVDRVRQNKRTDLLLEKAIRLLKKDKRYKDMFLIETVPGMVPVEKPLVLNREVNMSFQKDNVIETQIFARVRNELNVLSI